MSEYARKLDAALAELKKTRMSRRSYAPVMYRVLRVLGVEVRPPQYTEFFSVYFLQGAVLGSLIGMSTWLSKYQDTDLRLVTVVLFLGILVGVARPLFCVYERWKWGLSAWEEL